ncbi:unnamed protein product [Larinioides sclopetarius]|uniref:A disintegrin and metalloproteinase with thrombospondin motifs 9 n=1 Tax=Larinioides sclopetarius TaxID=280406 RepID=A0AAV1ZHP3_9ARAC
MLTPVILTLAALYTPLLAHKTPDQTDDSPRITVYPVRIDMHGIAYPHHLQFRRKGQATWHGKTRYKFQGYNRTWIIELQPYHHHLKFNLTKLEARTIVQSGCYYKGRVIGEIISSVKVSLCEGMTGDIHLSEGDYVISPFSYNASSFHPHHLSPLQHLDSERWWRPLLAEDIQFCDVKDELMDHEKQEPLLNRFQTDSPSNSSAPLIRKKRSESRELHLEVLVVADSKMARYHGPNLDHYILTLMSTVALIYKDPSIGNHINIAVVDIVVLNETADNEIIHHIAPITLRKFCRWQHKHNRIHDSDPKHYDTAILITREDLCRFPGACDTLGLAQSGMVCDSESSCAIVEDNGLSAAFTIAHELGHVMSIPHDDDSKCSRFHSQKKKLHVMARMLDYNSHPWSWSECSRQYLTTFFDVGYGRCLMDKPGRNRLLLDDEFQQPPGQLYPRDRQCELVFGPKSRICPYMPECKRLWCTMDGDSAQGGCRTQHMPWADGTLCGESKRCYQGECIRYRPAGLTPIDGQWGKWKPFGTCSRTCGGGIQQAFRECDSPKPSNGGRYCTGIRVKYKSCNTHDCPPGSGDFRAEQCTEFNDKDINLPGVPQWSTKWVPQYTGIPPHDKCKLYCKINDSSSYFVLREKVIDGTPCDLGSFDICVNGKCEIAGCDHILHSKVSLDRCGVCGGSNNTCKEIKGNFNKKVDYGYHNVVMIPPGASNLRVIQHSPDGSVDDNYIALKDASEKYILNGDFMISMFPKTLAYHGITIDYSGSHSVIEHINSSDPLTKDLFVQVLVVGKLQPPNISFSYTVPLTGTRLYSWKLATQYSECTRLCNGISSLKPICVRLSDQYPVNEDHCNDISKPSLQKTRKCNEHCILKWQDVSKLDCSVQCRRGIRQRIIKCMKEERLTKIAHAVPEEHCMHLGPKPSSQEKCSISCRNSSWIYSDWSECSVSCGIGTQHRTSECRNAENIKQPEDHCDSSTKIVSKVCDQGPCPHWMVGNWTECSVTCGLGVKQRPFWCQHENKYVDRRYCENDNTPIAKETCNMGDCFEWKTGPWEPCPVKCGNGTTHRVISCQSSSNQEVDESYCSSLNRPPTSKSCSSGFPCSSNFSVKKKNPFHNRFKEWKPPPLRTLSDTNSIPEFNRAIWKEGSWSKCSNTCGEGVKRRTITCHDSHDDSRLSLSYCDSKRKPKTTEKCIGRQCTRWETEEWSECSVSCGNGVKRRQVVCYNIFDGVESFDCDLHRKPSETLECNNGPCPDWSADKWSECSVSCGNGTQVRSVLCFNDNGEIMPDISCNLLKKPKEEQSCYKQPCSELASEFNWIIGPWPQCSASCGEGTQFRSVVCLSTEGHEEAEEKCPSPKPIVVQSCVLGMCSTWKWSEWSQCPKSCGFHQQYRHAHCIRGERIVNDEDCFEPKPATERRQCKIPLECSYKWRKGLWSPCYASCGSTYKTREVVCVDNENNRVPEELCSSQNRPKTKRKCNLKACPYTWLAGQWSECSKTCSEGIRERHVACHAVNEYGWVEPEEVEKHFCGMGAREPKRVEACNYGNCSSGFIWKPEEWQSCKGPCHNAKQKRKLHCFDLEGKRVPNRRCNTSLKPKKKRRCTSSPECPPKSCLDIHNSQRKTADGNYQIVVKGKLVIVYCHAMNTLHPQEYINLRDRNYAVIHSTSLGSQYDTSERCLTNNVGRECDCDRKDFGYSVFSKIALNISSLKLITDDYTFSQTYHGKPVPYGTAGDCFRKPDCPQGMFFISLQGTGFRVAHDTNWISKTGAGQIVIRRTMNDEVVKGKCGGYCDLCIPDPKIGLSVDIS